MSRATIHLQNSDALEILGFSRNAKPSPEQIQSAFHNAAAMYHPDRGGDTEAMRGIIAARDCLLPSAADEERHAKRRAATLESPRALEMQAFSERVGVNITDCWLALQRIQKWGLTLDHPRAAVLARGEANRAFRETHALGMSLESAEMLSASAGGLDDEMANLAEKCRDALSDEKLAPGQEEGSEDDRRIDEALELKHSVKPRDKNILELRFDKGLSIAEIAAHVGKTRSAIYAAFDRMCPVMHAAKERKEWADKHCNLDNLTGKDAPAPVVLEKDGQLGWNLDGDDGEVQP
ncbi:sigma factor-like helix-turn-helix DNA-binding protein [Acidithiobacillus sp. HP-11]|uniref:sigma factor-like helix-turn-helix DNA-binding protein n=1 Tax=Acidithiobacillus sp. HP-11 TaxID=2697656 RepID=UPI00187ACA25|nr:sigma factor-like helix-turn-helix DNA-binding protein [Acidithiobacillus sp. HP-11]MBE7567815.1 hypothetical protein [Acidithiobacillus sp. HP-11]